MHATLILQVALILLLLIFLLKGHELRFCQVVKVNLTVLAADVHVGLQAVLARPIVAAIIFEANALRLTILIIIVNIHHQLMLLLLLLTIDLGQLIDLILDETCAIFPTCTLILIQFVFDLINRIL